MLVLCDCEEKLYYISLYFSIHILKIKKNYLNYKKYHMIVLLYNFILFLFFISCRYIFWRNLIILLLRKTCIYSIWYFFKIKHQVHSIIFFICTFLCRDNKFVISPELMTRDKSLVSLCTSLRRDLSLLTIVLCVCKTVYKFLWPSFKENFST